MKKLLYIPVNSKPENMSTSKRVGREFVNRFMTQNGDWQLEELDLYNEAIPEINHRLFTGRGIPAADEDYSALSQQERDQADRIITLCEQFLSADIVVFAAPMWSMSFPSMLKKYVDCIIVNGKTIALSEHSVKGLLHDKERAMVYIQSSGGVYPKIFDGKLNHGVDYIHDIFKFLGVSRFEKILVQGTDDDSVGKDEAIKRAYKDIDHVIEKLSERVLYISH